MLSETNQMQKDKCYHLHNKPKTVTLVEAEIGMVVARGWEEEEEGWLSKGNKVSFAQDGYSYELRYSTVPIICNTVF
jgi:hypothetical protein